MAPAACEARASAQRLGALLAPMGTKVDAKFDEKTERSVLVLTRTQHGIVHHSYVDADFLKSGDYDQIKRTAQLLQGLLGEGAYVKRGSEQQPVKEFREAIEWLLAEVQRGVGIQRYKGLGEMNPEQLWETTLNPRTRRLLRVDISDQIITDRVINELMGKDPSARFRFIMDRAEEAEELDV